MSVDESLDGAGQILDLALQAAAGFRSTLGQLHAGAAGLVRLLREGIAHGDGDVGRLRGGLAQGHGLRVGRFRQQPAAIDQILEQRPDAFAFDAEILGRLGRGLPGHVLEMRRLALRRLFEAGDDVGEALAGQLRLHLGGGAEAVGLLHQTGGGRGDLLGLQFQRGFEIGAGLLGGGDQLVALRDRRDLQFLDARADLLGRVQELVRLSAHQGMQRARGLLRRVLQPAIGGVHGLLERGRTLFQFICRHAHGKQVTIQLVLQPCAGLVGRFVQPVAVRQRQAREVAGAPDETVDHGTQGLRMAIQLAAQGLRGAIGRLRQEAALPRRRVGQRGRAPVDLLQGGRDRIAVIADGGAPMIGGLLLQRAHAVAMLAEARAEPVGAFGRHLVGALAVGLQLFAEVGGALLQRLHQLRQFAVLLAPGLAQRHGVQRHALAQRVAGLLAR